MINNNADWALVYVTLALTITTIFLVIVAAFQDRIRSWFWKPKIEINFDLEEPSCSKDLCKGYPKSIHHEMVRAYTESTYDEEVLYVTYNLRAEISNTGKISAKNVEVIINNIERYEEQKWNNVNLPLDNLLWRSYTNKGDRKIYCEFISPDTKQYISIGHIYEPQYFRDKNYSNMFEGGSPRFYIENKNEALLSFDVSTKTYDQYYIIKPGKYRFNIKTGAENCKSKSKNYEFEFSGRFTKKEDEMLNEEMKLKEI